MGKFKDLTGQVFGKLTVIERAEKGKYSHARWKCKCECGNTTIVTSGSLNKGTTKSCGCLLRKHGKSYSRIYIIWKNMKARCYNQHSTHYSSYGGRGINICDEWKNNFQAFNDWALTNGYSENLSIDRIDVNGNYCPENCRWITAKEQQMNKRNNINITYQDKTQTLTQWANETGIGFTTLYNRIYRHNWPIEKALTDKIK